MNQWCRALVKNPLCGTRYIPSWCPLPLSSGDLLPRQIILLVFWSSLRSLALGSFPTDLEQLAEYISPGIFSCFTMTFILPLTGCFCGLKVLARCIIQRCFSNVDWVYPWPHSYKVCTSEPGLKKYVCKLSTCPESLTPSIQILINFSSNCTDVPSPDPLLLALHVTCAQVMNKSGRVRWRCRGRQTFCRTCG